MMNTTIGIKKDECCFKVTNIKICVYMIKHSDIYIGEFQCAWPTCNCTNIAVEF